jgi:pilus assembly protein Flp/PilA
MKKIIDFLRNEDGVTALEYSLIGALIAVAIITAVTAAGTAVSGVFNTIATKLGAAG